MTEVCTLKYRGKFIILLNAMMSVGTLYAWILAFMILKSYKNINGDWKKLTILSSLPNLAVPILCKIFLHESPRILIVKN